MMSSSLHCSLSVGGAVSAQHSYTCIYVEIYVAMCAIIAKK